MMSGSCTSVLGLNGGTPPCAHTKHALAHAAQKAKGPCIDCRTDGFCHG